MAAASPAGHVREFVRSCVRAGLLTPSQVYDEAVLAIGSELPGEADPAATATGWVAEFRDELLHDQATWAAETDYDRLQAVFAELTSALGLVVLQGCEDHWAAKAVLDDPEHGSAGVVWFTAPDVWHAIDEGMLEVNVWHPDTANIAPGDALLDAVIGVFARHGLAAHFDEGRIEVAAHWQRRMVAQ